MARKTVDRWLRFSWVIAILGVSASLAGLLLDRPYENETRNWQGQAIGQDIVNLLAFPILVVCATLAKRGSSRAYLVWDGVLAYCTYTFAIYAFSIGFGPLFLVYVAILGLSTYVLIESLIALDMDSLKATFSERTPRRSTGVFLIVIGGMFYLLWLSEILPATLAGEVPPTLREAGLTTNPVYVLDMAFLLPVAILSGASLFRQRASGLAFAPVVLTALVFIALGIVSAMIVLGSRGEPAPVGVTVAVGTLAVVQLGFLVRFLSAARGTTEPPVRTQ